jgi:hypothetical protein
MAPTVPLAKAPGGGPPRAPGAKVEAGASTVPLTKAPSVVPKAPAGGTSPMAKAGGPTQNLPKATVQLAKSPGTQVVAKSGIATPPSAPVKRGGEESTIIEDERDPEAGLAPLAVVCTVLALALMALNLFGSDRAGFYAEPGSDSPFMVPQAPLTPWEKETAPGSGEYQSSFNAELKKITDKFE